MFLTFQKPSTWAFFLEIALDLFVYISSYYSTNKAFYAIDV